MSGRMIGAKPRPRALVSGFDDATAEKLSDLFPTSRTIGDSLDDLLLDEWDVLVLRRGAVQHLASHLFLIGFGSASYGYPHEPSSHYDYLTTYESSTLSQEFQIPDGLHPDVRALVERQLLPLARGRERNPIITQTGQYTEHAVGPQENWFSPFLLTSEPTVLAGSMLRVGEKAEAWCIPEGVSDPIPWVRAAIRVWHLVDPTRFPIDPGWPSDPRWMTEGEAELLRATEAVAEERRTFDRESRAREEELRLQYARAADEADAGVRRLLTAQSTDLVDAVQAALESLGFTVENRDLVNPPNDLLEDLWVTSPTDDPDWIALVEVKGYTGGAQLGALISITARFVPRFHESNGRYPSRVWYIANQFIGRDPGTRPPMLAGNESELAEFQASNGLVLDTADLFSIAKEVSAGRLSRDSVRQELIQVVGRFSPETTEE